MSLIPKVLVRRERLSRRMAWRRRRMSRAAELILVMCVFTAVFFGYLHRHELERALIDAASRLTHQALSHAP